MTPETERFLEKADKMLRHADTMVSVGLNEDAGRTAYLASFHAAQAFIFEATARVLKSHNGVQKEFLRLTKDDPHVPAELRIFLSQAYNLKAIADYETGPGAEISSDRAAGAVNTAKLFVSYLSSRVCGAGLDNER